MTDLSFDDPCILFALRRESRPFLQEFRPQQRFPGAPCWARFCGPAWLTVLALETGVGRQRIEQTMSWLLGRPVLGNVPYGPRLVLAAGFAGALRQEHKVGDVILATEVVGPDGKCWPATWPPELPAGQWRPPLHRGRVLTVERLIADPAAKRSLGQQHGALAVDMESSVVADHCARHGVPFGCVRGISDDVHTPLSPRLVSLLADGRVSALRTAGALLRAPRLAREFWRLARDTKFAAGQLSKALGELLTLTLPFGADL